MGRVGPAGSVCVRPRAVSRVTSKCLATSSLHPRPGLPCCVLSIQYLVKRIGCQENRNMPGRKWGKAGLRKTVLSRPRSCCATVCVQTLRTPTFCNPSVGPGGSDTPAGTELPPSCSRTRSSGSSFLLKLQGQWLHLNGFQHTWGMWEVTSLFYKNWKRASVLGKKSTSLRCQEDIQKTGRRDSGCEQQVWGWDMQPDWDMQPEVEAWQQKIDKRAKMALSWKTQV